MENGTQVEERGGPDVLDARILSAVERWVLVSALALAAIAAGIWQTPLAVGSAAAGGLIAVLNLAILKRTVQGILWGTRRTKTALSVVLFFKMGLLLTTIWAAVRLLGLEPVGVAMGVSSLVMGIIGGTLVAGQQQVGDRAQPE